MNKFSPSCRQVSWELCSHASVGYILERLNAISPRDNKIVHDRPCKNRKHYKIFTERHAPGLLRMRLLTFLSFKNSYWTSKRLQLLLLQCVIYKGDTSSVCLEDFFFLQSIAVFPSLLASNFVQLFFSFYMIWLGMSTVYKKAGRIPQAGSSQISRVWMAKKIARFILLCLKMGK